MPQIILETAIAIRKVTISNPKDPQPQVDLPPSPPQALLWQLAALDAYRQQTAERVEASPPASSAISGHPLGLADNPDNWGKLATAALAA
nr:uncharacterized protein CI109_002132 [Kwoniella shandongensis]KAA5529706.1 hypothetical protein CI109_002132 [Kwoniella shandongensis]